MKSDIALWAGLVSPFLAFLSTWIALWNREGPSMNANRGRLKLLALAATAAAISVISNVNAALVSQAKQKTDSELQDTVVRGCIREDRKNAELQARLNAIEQKTIDDASATTAESYEKEVLQRFPEVVATYESTKRTDDELAAIYRERWVPIVDLFAKTYDRIIEKASAPLAEKGIKVETQVSEAYRDVMVFPRERLNREGDDDYVRRYSFGDRGLTIYFSSSNGVMDGGRLVRAPHLIAQGWGDHHVHLYFGEASENHVRLEARDQNVGAFSSYAFPIDDKQFRDALGIVVQRSMTKMLNEVLASRSIAPTVAPSATPRS